MNKYLSTIFIAPIISTLKKYTTRVPVNHNEKKGMIAINQVRTINKKRIIKLLGKLNQTEIKTTKEVIKETFID